MQPQRHHLPGLCLLLLSRFLLHLEAVEAGRPGVTCPAACLCASNILSCSKQQLPSVPQVLPSYTALLDLSHNNLSRLRAEWTPIQLPHLHSLLLSHNYLHFISSEAFTPVPHLRYLDLSSNQLRRWMSSYSASSSPWRFCCSTTTTSWRWTAAPSTTWSSCRSST